jgi:hypothetical protein
MNFTLDQLISWLCTVMQGCGFPGDVEAKFQAALAQATARDRAEIRRGIYQGIRGAAGIAWACGKPHEVNALLRSKGFPSLMEMDDLMGTLDTQLLKQGSTKIPSDEQYDVVKAMLDDLESGLTKNRRIELGRKLREYEDREKTI